MAFGQEYYVCHGEDINALVAAVNSYTNQGWRCKGGIVFVPGQFKGYLFMQAVVRAKPIKDLPDNLE